MKTESMSRKRKGKREYLNNLKTRDLLKLLYKYFEAKVKVPRIRVARASLLAKFLREERKTWIPRVAIL